MLVVGVNVIGVERKNLECQNFFEITREKTTLMAPEPLVIRTQIKTALRDFPFLSYFLFRVPKISIKL